MPMSLQAEKPDWADALERGEKPAEVIRTPLIVRAEDATVDGDGAITLRMRASHESEDRYGTIIEQSGLLLGQFKRNPVIPWTHDYTQPPVAKATSVFLDADNAGSLVEDWEFTPRDVYPFGHMIGELYQKGFMSASSIGFMPMEYERREHSHGMHSWGAYRFKTSELWETSSVLVPGQQEALVVGRAVDNIDLSPMAEWAGRFLDRVAGDDAGRAAIERLWKNTAVRAIVVDMGAKSREPDGQPPADFQPDPTRDPEPAPAIEAREAAAFQNRMPLAPDAHEWDAAAADSVWRNESGSATTPSGTYWRAFAWFDRADRENFAAYKLAIADTIGGRLHVVREAVTAALAGLESAGIPAEDKTALRLTLARYLDKFKARDDEQRRTAEAEKREADPVVVRVHGLTRGAEPVKTPTHEKSAGAFVRLID